MSKTSTASRNFRIVSKFASIVRGLVFILLPFWPKRRTTFLAILSEQLVPVFDNDLVQPGGLKFWCFGGWPSFRAQSVTDKETATIAWIDGFQDNSTFWDIGANVGVFSLYAAQTKPGMTVFGFEPSATNFAVFVNNIEQNRLDDKITPMLLALSSQTKLDYLHMPTNMAGNTGGQFGQADSSASFKQGILGFSADDLVKAFDIALPNYIKIDVDGLEKEILVGAKELLQQETVKSVAIELTVGSPEQIEAHAILEEAGFALKEAQDTVVGKDVVKNYFYFR
ncbi:MAG: FkbM family methyltransferase [Cohaesibacter sp.]|jgi:FkbM family methyltransferase|nr:FkbM family methyltransferase [Cohaesibacter sp.]